MSRLTREELIHLIDQGEIETVLAVFPDWYGRLMGKRLTARFFEKSVASHGWHACDYLLGCDMEMDPVPGYAFTSWETGYGDMRGVPDWSTLRRAAWLERTAIVFCDLASEPGDAPIEVAPRRILRRQVERASRMGFVAKGGAELELYLFKETYDSAREKNWHGLVPFGSYVEDYHVLEGTREDHVIGEVVRALEKSGIPMEGSKGEWGPGQQEINVEYCELLEQADRNALTKHAAKEIAHAQGLAVSFMAKWDERFAGSGLHQHISLWDAGAKSLFAGDERLGPISSSETFRHFLGGILASAGDLAAFWAPSVNSYKRFQSASFAPTAIAWSFDNRTAGFRVVGEGDALRIECRIPGADANPYVAWAATLAAGLDGIEKKIEPPPIFEGDVYAAKALPRVPGNLRDAISRLEKSTMAKDAFGEDVVLHYLHFLKTEQRKFDEIVTSWERARFFERG